jgi:hypothetical protein
MAKAVPQPETIDRLATAVYPSFAMLAGMQLDQFTLLQDGPLRPEALADILGVDAARLIGESDKLHITNRTDTTFRVPTNV